MIRCLNHQFCDGFTPLPEFAFCVLCIARMVALQSEGYPRYGAAHVGDVLIVEDAVA